MFVVNDDLSIYATRGDIVCLNVSATDDRTGEPYEFQPGDILQMKIFVKKDAESVVLQKDFPVPAKTNTVGVFLTEQDTKFGDVISKPTDYWYEVTLNPYTNPQTFIGYDEDGAKIFKLFPEGKDITTDEPTKPEDIPVVDVDLSLLSSRPVENRAIARAIALVKNDMTLMDERLTGKIKENKKARETVAEELAVERARIDNLIAIDNPTLSQPLAYLEAISEATKAKVDGSIKSDGVFSTITVNWREANQIYGGTTADMFIIPDKCRPMETGAVHTEDGLEYSIKYDGIRYYMAIKALPSVTVAPSGAGTVTFAYALGDYELKDIRVGADGETFDSAGSAVRKQFSRKVDKLGVRQISGHNLAFAETGTNILPPIAVDTSEAGMQLNAETGEVYEASACSVTGYIPIEPNATYYFYAVSVYGYALIAFNRAVLYDENHKYIQSITDNENHEFTTPENAAFLRFSEGNGTGVTLHNKYLGKVNHAPYLPSSQWFRLPEKREINTESINLFNANSLLENSRIKITSEHGVAYTSAEMVNPTNGYYRTEFIELDTTKTRLFCGVKVFEGVRYTDGDQKDLAFFDDQYRYIGAAIHLADGNAIPETARYVLHHTGYLDTIISYEKQDVFCKQNPVHSIGNKEIAVVDKENTWNGKVWAAYGDSIAAISNGNSLKEGWAEYVNSIHKFGGFYGRSIGGQRYSWGNAGGAVAFINADGTFNSRNDAYNLDNYMGDIPDGCTAIRGAFCSWSRITAMFPDDIKDTIDMVFIMGGTNDELNDTPVKFIEGAQTDPEWAASDKYAVYGGDYNINTLRGGMASTVMKFHAWMPNAVIVIGTNLSGKGAVGEVGTDLDISEYSKALIEKEMASRMSCPCIDVYSTCGINPWNSPEYISDGVHPYTDGGKMMLGRTVAGGLNSITPKLAIIEK